jgi:hypothetical protein
LLLGVTAGWVYSTSKFELLGETVKTDLTQDRLIHYRGLALTRSRMQLGKMVLERALHVTLKGHSNEAADFKSNPKAFAVHTELLSFTNLLTRDSQQSVLRVFKQKVMWKG